MASADLLWQIVRNNNKYLQKRNNIRLSSDPFNNSGKATKRHAGFIQPKAAVIRLKKEKTLQVYVKDGSAPNKPAKQWVKKDVATKVGPAAAAVKAVRPDLVQSAARRARKLGITANRIVKVRASRAKHTAERKAKKGFKRTNKRVQKSAQKK